MRLMRPGGPDRGRRSSGPIAAIQRVYGRWRHRRGAKLLAVGLAVALVAAACGYAWAAKHVNVVVDGRARRCFSLRLTVRGVLADAGIELHPRDQVTPALDERVGEGGTIEVRRALPVLISADGRVVETMTAQTTVAGVLREAGVALSPDDRVEPSPSTAPASDLTVRVVRVAREYQTKLWRIPKPVHRREDHQLELGISRVVAKGRDGVEEVTFCTTYEDGVEVDRAISRRQVLTEPVVETVAVGTAGSISRDGETIRFRKAMQMTATAYYWGPECTGQYADGLTCVGLPAKKGVVAVDPRIIPLWTRLYIDGYGHAVAGDIGSAIKGNKIDLCYDTYEEALNYGRQRVKVYILW